jgi:hypothetical protein
MQSFEVRPVTGAEVIRLPLAFERNSNGGQRNHAFERDLRAGIAAGPSRRSPLRM